MGGILGNDKVSLEEAKKTFQSNVGIGTWFAKIQQASTDFFVEGRVAWVKLFWVRAKEVPGWEPDFMEDNDDDSDNDDDLINDLKKDEELEGGSILQVMEEMVKETKMESIDLFSIKRCWGNLAFDYAHSASVDLSEKKNCCGLLVHVIAQWSGEVCLYKGDFNEVQKKDERFGSVFNVHGANAFKLPHMPSTLKLQIWESQLQIIAHKDPFPDLATVRSMVATEELRLRSRSSVLPTGTTSSAIGNLADPDSNNSTTHRNHYQGTLPMHVGSQSGGLNVSQQQQLLQLLEAQQTMLAQFGFNGLSGQSRPTAPPASSLDYWTRQILLRCDSTGDLYPVTSLSYPQAFLVGQQTWHQRLGHPLGKHVRLPFSLSEIVVKSPFEIIHSDLWTSPLSSVSGIKYYALFFALLVGISVTRNTSGMFLSQQKYAFELLERAGMLTCNPCRTPVDTDSKLSADGDLVSDPTLYSQVCWVPSVFDLHSLIYLLLADRFLSLPMPDPREPHFSALKRILRYIRGTMPYGLHLFSSTTSSLVAYSDADWAGCPTTRRSTSGYCVFLGNNLLSWSSKRQVTLSRSSAEAEYRGAVLIRCIETYLVTNLYESFIHQCFDKFVEDSWKEAGVVEPNAMTKLMKKLKHLKEKIRLWNKENTMSSINRKRTLKSDLADYGLIISKGCVMYCVSPSFKFSHLFYADDVIFMGQWNESNLDTIVQVLECFHRASGLHLNMSKSKLMGIYVDAADQSSQAARKNCS
ncbi:ribonuclease H-like domain-containing protein [Tanacetum coccineum]